MNKNTFLTGLGALTILSTSSAEAKKTSPNIIYILADDMGYGDLGCYGQQKIKTPNLDKMAAQGMKFSQHYAGTAVSAPSRAVLMTGLHTGHAEIRGNKEVNNHGQKPLSDSAITVAKCLQDVGYGTALYGKWGLGNEGTSGEPTKQGFDTYYGYLDQILAHNAFPAWLMRNGKKEYLKNEVVFLDSTEWHRGYGSYSTKQVEYAGDLFTNEALKFIEKKQQNPFFLYLAYTIPHDNGEAPEGFKQEAPTLAPYENETWKRDAKAYAASITRLDQYVGRIMAALDSLGLSENTVLMFSSDNGNEYDYGFKSNGIYRGVKRDLYEGGMREPFIVRWPGTVKAGSVSHELTAFWDFLPTACEIAGVKAPANIDGISYLPTLKAKKQKRQHKTLYWEFHEQGGKMAVRKGDWKAVKLNVQTLGFGAKTELYNLKNDPAETTNIAEIHPSIVKKLDQIMTSSHRKSSIFTFYFEK